MELGDEVVAATYPAPASAVWPWVRAAPRTVKESRGRRLEERRRGAEAGAGTTANADGGGEGELRREEYMKLGCAAHGDQLQCAVGSNHGEGDEERARVMLTVLEKMRCIYDPLATYRRNITSRGRNRRTVPQHLTCDGRQPLTSKFLTRLADTTNIFAAAEEEEEEEEEEEVHDKPTEKI
ncbi:hypothetical protein B296_00002712 [Ensete ventricosum]|uniref:Uncharacterized protein n=1 Tax=Ensete ventricosum TaxID=4639 RepID=A0A427ARE7_ENSVE|nr:hypothetical protein B296_00002712 [Ensete ventricosum]